MRTQCGMIHKIDVITGTVLGLLLLPSILFAGWYCFVLGLATFFGLLLSSTFPYETAFIAVAVGGTGVLGCYVVVNLIVNARGALRSVSIFSFLVFTLTFFVWWAQSPPNRVAMNDLWYIPIYINATTLMACLWTVLLYVRTRLGTKRKTGNKLVR